MTDNPNGDFSGSFGIPDTIDISEKEKSEDLGIPDLTAFASERFFKGVSVYVRIYSSNQTKG